MPSGARQIQCRRLVLAGLCLNILSCAFPVAASVLPAGPVWVGWLDMVLAFAVTVLAFFCLRDVVPAGGTRRGSLAFTCIES